MPEAPAALLRLLDPAAGALLVPIRSEIFGPQRFAQHGRSLGLTHDARRATFGRSTFFPRLRDNVRMLRQAHQVIADRGAAGHELSPASLWLLDNFHLIEAQLQAIHEGLPRSYFRALPVLQDEPLAGLPRIYGVAWAFVAHTDGAFDEDLLYHYLAAYQDTRPLNLSEMWALPTTLRVVLIENLRRLAERLATHKAAREVANLVCDRIETTPLNDLLAMLALAGERGASAAFLAQLGQRLQDRAHGMSERVPDASRAWLQGVLPNAAAVQAQQSVEQTADNASVSNAVASLRAIGDADWPDLVDRTSLLLRMMQAWPLFVAESVGTRDQTLHGIEALARRSGRSELAVGQALLQLMAAPADPGEATDEPAEAAAQRGVAAYWLSGPGRDRLERTLGLGGPLTSAWRRLRPHGALPLYLGTVALGTAALVGTVATGAGHAGGGPVPLWLLALLALPASEVVIALLHRLVSESTTPHHLPRLALAQGIPPEQRVMVVIPGMLSSAAGIDELVHRLRLHQLANPEAEAQFALLTDWRDAEAPRADDDDTLLARATQRVQALNAGAADENRPWPRFVLLHRRRRFSRTESRWIGWERKRGKLEQLMALLVRPPGAADGDDGGGSPFVDLGPLSTVAPGVRHVVTLDSDTQLPPGRLRELVGVAAHPANRARLNAAGTRVVAGFGILQPRLVTPLPSRSEDTFFHRLFAGQCGIDPYSSASSEIHQDLFGEGSYTGKGLLDVHAVHAVLGGNLPEGQVLSHDLLEGALARCAAVTDVTLMEDAPFHAEVAASRVHRWTRGDWQLLPILLRSLVQPARYPLGAVNRWKMADNLRRSLVPPASLLLLASALAGVALAPWPVLALVLAAFGIGGLMGAVAGLVPSRVAVAQLHFHRLATLDLLRALGGALWHGAMLLQHAMAALDAVVRALYRTLVSQRHLLQWTTAAEAQAAATGDLGSAIARRRGVPLAAALLLALLWRLGSPHLALAAAACAVWGAAPLWSWFVSRTGFTRQAEACAPEDVEFLHAVARDTWRYFERTVTADDRHLPPDNLQTVPHEMLARRTSPTNIGLYLLSVACARQFGWIATAEMQRRLTATLDTLDTLPRHRGHFLNWYDTGSGAPLLPMYVSTVDSGNLCGHLLAVAQACRERADDPADEPAQTAAGALRTLADRCEALAWQPAFDFLYHPRRHLLHIGYRVAERQLDDSFYDLLASEARLTSLLAIAKGDVPVRHWAALGRPFYAVGATAALRSWSGSMFEYLMPTLVLAEPHGSVLHEAGLAAVVEQQDFARERGVPWGISESAYAGCDHTLAYQYAPQGVPRLALRRTPPDELVIAPYATLLAALRMPHRARLNLDALAARGARGTLGFIEALDYTPSRQASSEAVTLVHTFMAHHQGMSIVALANVLLDGAPQRWGGANAHVQAVSSLLHERAPREVSRLTLPPQAATPVPARDGMPARLREVRPGHHAIEPTHLLSNGRYGVALRPNGAGHSRLGTADLTRRRDDALRDAAGSFFWLRRQAGEAPVSLTQHPAPDPAAEYRSVFHADRVVFDTVWTDLHVRITVWVSPEDDIEFRQVELHNLGNRPLALELISAFEVTLADARADEAHPAFGNLFVQARAHAEPSALLFERRPRLATEEGLHLAHFVAESLPVVGPLRWQTDRQAWLGRNRAPWAPRAALNDWPAEAAADGTPALDTGLDPLCALAASVPLAAGGKARVTFATAAGSQAHRVHAVVDKHRQIGHVQRASLMSATLTGIRLRDLGLGANTSITLQTLTTALLLTITRPQAERAGPAVSDRRLLWRFGLSGEKPLVLVSVNAMPGLGLVRSLTQALSLWSWGGVACDLVVVNGEPASYLMPLQHELSALRDRHEADVAARAGQALCGWHLLRAEDLSAPELATLQAVARLRLLADGRPLSHHLDEWAGLHEQALATRQEVARSAPVAAPHTTLAVPASRGDFIHGGAAFRFAAGSAQRPTRPWINVLANPDFGSQVSEAGGGTTWAVNSRMNQLTPWSNDPVADPPGEWLLLQDRRTRKTWSVVPSALGAAGVAYEVTHGQGHTTITHRTDDLEVSARWCVDARRAVKQVQLRVINRGPRTRNLRLVAMTEWMLGAQRTDRASVHTAAHHQRLARGRLLALLATQQEHGGGFGGGTAFLALAGADDEAGDGRAPDDEHDWTCDRREAFDARGRPVVPEHWGRRQGAGLDPCAALAVRLELVPGAVVEHVLLTGWAPTTDAARTLAALAAATSAGQRLAEARAQWDTLLAATTVHTPDPLFDALVNRWLLYQAVGCRLWAKAGFYQAGGATGFRDQLQDTMALAWAAPAMLRAQIVLCAGRQFTEGDVQHWWHAPQGTGVRTHFSDDLLWLPYALAHYLQRCGDASVLDESVPFIEGQVIPEGAEDAYGQPTTSAEHASVYEHAARAIDHSLRTGVHGLPLMGSGDWNDGMNRVGHGGRGESVWLAWFLCRVVADFAPVARARGEVDRAQRWEAASQGWMAALQDAGWDGAWYRRAFFDDGQPLGSHTNPEARIDLIAQAWSVLADGAPPERQLQAMAAVREHLVDDAGGLIRLLDPPLALAEPSAGYIQAYPPGVRENGGQYSHGGVWALMAQARLAKRQPDPAPGLDLAWRYYRDLSPAHRAADELQGARYGIEPYVIAGDVYTAPPYVGRGGWSWYTGAAAWLHRAAIESIVGLQLGAETLSFEPGLPSHWPRVELTLKREGRTLRFLLLRCSADAALRAAAPWALADDLRLLLPGQVLRWQGLPTSVRFVVPVGLAAPGGFTPPDRLP